jgi:hypothetical protein
MSEVQETTAQPALVKALLRLPPAEQQRLPDWSRGLGEIRYGTLRGFKKEAAMLALTRDRKAAWPLLKVLSLALKNVVRDARSWTFRLGVGAIIATFVAAENGGVGIVALGGGLGLPLWMLIGIGGVSIGLLAGRIKARATARRRGSFVRHSEVVDIPLRRLKYATRHAPSRTQRPHRRTGVPGRSRLPRLLTRSRAEGSSAFRE